MLLDLHEVAATTNVLDMNRLSAKSPKSSQLSYEIWRSKLVVQKMRLWVSRAFFPADCMRIFGENMGNRCFNSVVSKSSSGRNLARNLGKKQGKCFEKCLFFLEAKSSWTRARKWSWWWGPGQVLWRWFGSYCSPCCRRIPRRETLSVCL